jgi:hypothetical protein
MQRIIGGVAIQRLLAICLAVTIHVKSAQPEHDFDGVVCNLFNVVHVDFLLGLRQGRQVATFGDLPSELDDLQFGSPIPFTGRLWFEASS